MIKLSSPKESICFNFENEEQKRFFDKAKKCDIIHNNNSIFLRKILSIKNQSLLEKTLKQSKSQIFHHISTSTYDPKKLNINTNNSSSNLTLNPKNDENSKKNILIPQLCLEDINLDNSFKFEISPKKCFSPKIIVNKNKNLGFHIHKEKEREKEKEKEREHIKEPSLYSDKTLFTEKENNNMNIQTTIESKIKEKYSSNTITTDFNINPELCFSNLYTKNYIRKPVVIKFKKGLNFNNIKNSNNINGQKIFPQEEENKENIPNNHQKLKKVKTETKIKPYNFYTKNTSETELFRNYEDLEKKSLEITKRKMKKNSINSPSNFKKEHNLDKLKESLENCRIKTKMNLKRKKKKKQNFINQNGINTNNIKFDSKKIIKKNKNITLNLDNKVEGISNNIKNQKNINSNIDIRWHRTKNPNINNVNFSYVNKNQNQINKNKRSTISKISKVKSEELLLDNPNSQNIKKKNIKINFIEENKTENIYNITLNTNNANEGFNRFHVSLDCDQSFKYKNYIIRKKYGKKQDNIAENNKNMNKKDLNKKLLMKKTFNEDNKMQYELNHCQSYNFLNMKNKKSQIKVNKKDNSGKKIIKINSSHKNIGSILDLEEKINDEINQHLKIINGIEIINEFITNYYKKLIKEKFELFCYYLNQINTINNTTILTNMSQLSNLTYIKKIIHKENITKKLKNNSSKLLMKHKSFNNEKRAILSIRRKDFGFLEKYEDYSDLIHNFRMLLIKYSLNNNMI